MVRAKMPQCDRAKQFAPFDALKGLQDSLRLKEYEHERTIKCDIMEEKAREISDTLLSLEKGDTVKVLYFFDGYNRGITGTAKLMLYDGVLKVGETEIPITDILDISILQCGE